MKRIQKKPDLPPKGCLVYLYYVNIKMKMGDIIDNPDISQGGIYFMIQAIIGARKTIESKMLESKGVKGTAELPVRATVFMAHTQRQIIVIDPRTKGNIVCFN